MPLFSPVYNSTRPYSQTRSNTQRALMQSDEVMRMDNRQCLVLLRGQKPMLLYKIIPDEFTAFQNLRFTPVREYIPQWRRDLETAQKAQKGPDRPGQAVPTQESTAPDMAPVEPSAAAQKSHTSSQAGQSAGMTEVEYDYELLAGGVELGMVETPLEAVLGDRDEAGNGKT